MTESRRPSWWLWPAFALLAFAGWRVFGLGLADHLAPTAPARALQWRDAHPEALLHAAEAKLPAAAAGEAASANAADPDAAAALARSALRADPLDGRAYRVLGDAAAVRGDAAAALAMYTLATTRAPRDVAAQLWMARHGLEQGDAVTAVRHLDLLMRVQPDLTARILPAMTDLAGRPEAHAALADRLAARPPWRTTMFVHATKDVVDIDVLGALVERLRAAPGGLDPTEQRVWVDRLARDGRWGQAYLTWASQLPPERLQRLENVYNGSFEWPLTEGGFGWRPTLSRAIRAERVDATGADGRFALRLAFSGQRTERWATRQMLALPPGRYRFSGRERSERLQTSRGVAWSVLCADGGRAPLGSSETIAGNHGWREFGFDFEIPAQGCGGQWLGVGVAARIPAESRVSGRVWFDALRIVKVP